jgi:drug/metabolite transporter (DMT)-like permease
MTIEYALTRAEVPQGFFESLRSSPKYVVLILFCSAVFGAYSLLLRGALFRHLMLRDIIIACIWAVGLLILMPLGMFVRAKTAKRTLTISPDGIYTQIGER